MASHRDGLEEKDGEMSPFGPFYCVFRWDLSTFEHPMPKPGPIQIRLARDNELLAVAEVWHRGLSQEEGSPWADYLKRWTPTSAAKWFLDCTKRLGGRILVAEKSGKMVGVNGIIFEKKSGVARFFTGVVVAPDERGQGIGSLLLYRSLLEGKKEGLRNAEVETIQGITATKHLYPKFGGREKIVAS